MIPDKSSRRFRIRVIGVCDEIPVDFLVVHPRRFAGYRPKEANLTERWIPSLAPSSELVALSWCGAFDWTELERRYGNELRHQAEQCEELRRSAIEHGIVLVSVATNLEQSIESALAAHLTELECEHRWRNGLMIGGLVSGVKDEITKLGGLYYKRHKAWMMPCRESWDHIHALLPGDF